MCLPFCRTVHLSVSPTTNLSSFMCSLDADRHRRQVSNEETLKLLQEESLDLHKIDPSICEFRFVPRSMDEMRTPAVVVAVFHDLGLKERWSINQETLSRFARHLLFFVLVSFLHA